jgi:hypothetical protein
MEFDYGFFKDIVLVAIPTTATAFTSKWITNSWQTKKQKNELKRKILTEYEESFVAIHTLTGIFAITIYDSYRESVIVDKDGGHIFPLKFPQEDNEKPSKKFYDKYRKMVEEAYALNYKINHFRTNILLYYQGYPELYDKAGKLLDLAHGLFASMLILFYSNNEQDFINNDKKFVDKSEKFSEELEKFEKDMIDKDLIIK